MTLDYKLADKSDLESLFKMVREYHHFDHIISDPDEVHSILERLIGDPSLGKVWIVQQDHQEAGYVILTFGYSVEYLGRTGLIDEIFVKPEFREKGLGSKILEFVKNTARGLGIRTLQLEAERENHRAIHVYEKSSFKNRNRVWMTCWLDS